MPETGTLIDGKYRILSKMREGGMGAIYKVHHGLLDEIRVIKVMRTQGSDNPDLQRRFAQEAQLITRVRHRNICLIFDYAVDEEMTAYIVMEYIEGVSLADWIKLSGPLEVPLALEIAHQSLEALEYLHRKRVIHRDISPENIMLTTDHDGRLLVKLIDLGIAKALDADDGVTKTGVFIGKFKYSSPEQLMSDGLPLDGRSDLYSLAVVLYQMLTGQLPIRGDTAHQLAAAHLFQPPIPFAESDPEGRIPEDVRETVLRALQKKRDDRFPDATTLLQTIESSMAKLPRPDMIEAAAFMELVQSTSEGAHPDHPTPTPSAQERLNRRFQPSETPLPMASTIDASINAGEATEFDSASVDGAPDSMPTVIGPSADRRRPSPLIWAAALLVIIGIAGITIFRQGPADMPENEKPAETSTSLPPDTASVATLLVNPQTSGPDEPDTTTAVMTTTATEEALVKEAAKQSQQTEPGRSVAERSRTRMLAAKTAAVSAGARELAGVLFASAEAAERRAESLFRSGRMDAAGGSFLSALRTYDESAVAAREETNRRVVQQANDANAAAARAEAERQRREKERRDQAQAELEKRKKTETAVETPRPAVSEEPRVRSAIQRYVSASESLNADAFLSVYPSADRRRIESGFASLRSQSLTLDIRSVEISGDGQSATVRATETRVATPRAGSEQRVGGERTITMARRGATWVITSIR